MKSSSKPRIRLPKAFIGALTLSLSAMGCGQLYQISVQSRLEGLQIGIGGGSTTTIRNLKPALAVRGMGCLNCHANIQGNVVSDFGYGNSFYMEQENSKFSQGSKIFTQSFYSPFSMQSIEQLSGALIVPQAGVPQSLARSSNQQLTDFLSDSSMPNYFNQNNGTGSWYTYFNLGTAPSTLSLDQAVSHSLLTGAQNVYIGAPSVSQILAIAPNPMAVAPWVQVSANEPGAGSSISGLTTASGSSGSYITNSGTIQCSGLDVVINGTLLLNHATFLAESGGCKLYVTGSVFIEGPIQYDSSAAKEDPSQNLQISSATSIIMGVGLNGNAYTSGTPGQMNSQDKGPNPLHIRLIDDARNPLFRIAQNPSDYSNWANSVYAEANNVGANLIQDASIIPAILPSGVQTATANSGQIRLSIQFQHLLLNAPVVHSRYLGALSGVIVSELADMALGQFNFSYDSVFSNAQVSILPALGADIVCVTNSGGKCSPVMQ